MYHVECNRDMFAEQPSMPWTLALCWCEWTGIYLVGAACSRRETGSRPHSCLWHPRHNLFHFARGVHKLETRNLPLLDCMPVSKHEVQPKPMRRVSRGILLVFCVLRFINHTQLHPHTRDYVRGDETHIAQYYASFLHVGDVEGHHSVVASLHAIGLDACGHFTKSTR